MPANHATKLQDKVKEGFEQAQARLTTLEDEAQKMVHDLWRKGRASRKEVSRELSKLLQRFNADELLEQDYLKEWSGKARHMTTDMMKNLEDVRARMVTMMGVASREQVEELGRDLDRISKKLDKIAGVKKSPMV